MATPTNLVDLRRQLAERFPSAHALVQREEVPGWPTGVAVLDQLLGGGLPRGEVTELVGEGHGSGTAQVIHAVLEHAAEAGRFLALVDGADSFDVDAATPRSLARLLWVRCRLATEALKAADLLLRDRNVPLVILDLKWNPPAQLRGVPSSVWHRLGRIAEHQGTSLLVVTPMPMVGAVTIRVGARSALGIEALQGTRSEVLGHLRFEVLRASAQTPVWGAEPEAGVG